MIPVPGPLSTPLAAQRAWRLVPAGPAGAARGRGLAGWVARPVAAIAAVVLVVVPWALRSLVPGARRPMRPGWNERQHRGTGAGSPRVPPPAPRPRTMAERARLVGSSVVVLALLVWLTPIGRTVRTALAGDDSPSRRPFRLAPNAPVDTATADITYRVPPGVTRYRPSTDVLGPALWGSDWHYADAYDLAQGWAFDASVAWRAVNPYRLLDFTSRYVNVVGGHRLSWSAPPCGCRRITVWMYGGSTTYGLDQRDDHTIASALAQLAYDDGIVVDVQNRGQLGQLHWMEAERFAWDVTIEPPPDLVLFYDGVNESWATNTLNNRVSGDTPPMIDPTADDIWNSSGRSDGPVPDGPAGSRFIGRPRGSILEMAALAEATVSRYDRSRALSRTTASRHGVTARYVWQPSRFDRPLELAEPHDDSETENRSRLAQQLMREQLPRDVIDVSEALATTPGPLFSDDVHHNERAARVVAAAIYERLEGDLRSIGSGARP